MPRLVIENETLHVRLSTLEKLGALSNDVSFPLAGLRNAFLSNDPYRELRGIRVGTGLPGVIVLGRMVYQGGTDFVAIYGRSPRTLILEFEGAAYRRLFISNPDAAVMARFQL